MVQSRKRFLAAHSCWTRGTLSSNPAMLKVITASERPIRSSPMVRRLSGFDSLTMVCQSSGVTRSARFVLLEEFASRQTPLRGGLSSTRKRTLNSSSGHTGVGMMRMVLRSRVQRTAILNTSRVDETARLIARA
jgi:hypothetical protein